ncbi:MAG TPA: hypothetical protein VJ698_07775 [Noviherbaspirillum sp.]|uniref:hypothetical protein n=1 Tax=Noviherbaspirillum sp. TaxID=1926288 RepID=UPI002B48BE4A|nr:hypothetical protein [Noviherbaspirillum sp.]HJV85362.1 hypothetical protein [Noviherbaspirillum sp.]
MHMKLAAALFALTALVSSAAVTASPLPPGHPAASASDTQNLPALTQTGKVVSTIDAKEYTYIEVAQDKKTLWLAAPAIKLKKDAVIRFEDGAVMTNFHSKLLNRTFDAVMFVNRVVEAK